MSENMLFCLGDGQYESSGEGYQKSYRVFNKQVEQSEWEEIKNSLDIKILPTKWIDKKDMTANEKENSSVWKEIGGLLRVLSYEEAWKVWWDEAKQSDKDKIINCKYFDSSIFFSITGLTEGNMNQDLNLSGEVVEVTIKGKKYKAVIS